MKPISFALPFIGLNVRIEAAPARRGASVRRAAPDPKPNPTGALPRRILQDIGLDISRRD